MPDIKISELTGSDALDGTEEVPIVQLGTTVKTTTQEIANLAQSSVVTVKVSVSSAEILNLNSSAKTLVAAPGNGKFINVLSIILKGNVVGTQYNTHTDLIIGTGPVYPIVTATGFLNFFSNTIAPFAAANIVGTSTNFNDFNQPLILFATGGNPVGGNGTMDVYVTYSIITF